MLTIRAQQFQALGHSLLETWILGHLTEFFPERICQLAAAEVRDRIRAAVAQARGWGFVSDSQLCRYVDLTFVFGSAFDKDPNLPWAYDILADRRLIDNPEMRMDILYSAAQDHLDQVEESEPFEQSEEGE